ncbi:hypothetical protein R6G85_06180 [Actinotignum urinale]|uniref:hypothetical protein n=1 Tax=Actinotignum urinale TaxID=190146 RepID=UPI002A7F8018|nr:hypothetical protein [Actinotignum urinale]MDY5152061.1 hypothetical protein [Actinotignum urinale]
MRSSSGGRDTESVGAHVVLKVSGVCGVESFGCKWCRKCCAGDAESVGAHVVLKVSGDAEGVGAHVVLKVLGASGAESVVRAGFRKLWGGRGSENFGAGVVQKMLWLVCDL